MIQANNIKKDFPIFKDNPQLTYLDSTATSLKPQVVIDKMNEYYTKYSANIFRGVYDISERATAEYEETRVQLQKYINAQYAEELLFTRNATESINLFVNGIKDSFKMDDEIVTTVTEHHSNFVPWQQLAKRTHCAFKVISVLDNGMLDSQMNYDITKKTKVLAITLASNVLGTINPLKQIILQARTINPQIIVVVDGAQAVPHMKVDVRDLGCDAFAFSSHKMLGPTGVGVLWVRKSLLETFPPYQFGGDMIRSVSIEETMFADLPHRFEAGTPHIAGVIALKEAVAYLTGLGLDSIHEHEVRLAQECHDLLLAEFGERIQIIGPQTRENGIVSFSVKGIHAHDIASLLNEDGIAVRAGHHCAMPLHTKLGVAASVRASFYLYNTSEDVGRLIASLKNAQKVFSS